VSYHIDLKKLFQDLRGPKGVAALTEELVKVSSEVDKLKNRIRPQAEMQLHKALTNFQHIQGSLKKAQTDLDKEIQKALNKLRKVSKKPAKASAKAKTKKAPARKKKRTTKKAV
jgi:hypothetical protein